MLRSYDLSDQPITVAILFTPTLLSESDYLAYAVLAGNEELAEGDGDNAVVRPAYRC